MRIIIKASELDVDRDIPVSVADRRSIVAQLTSQGCIVLDKLRDELNLIALQPKQDGRAKSDETGSHIGFAVSETIKETGNKNSGAMDLHDVRAQRSCTRGGRKIFMEFGRVQEDLYGVRVQPDQGCVPGL